MFKRLLLTSFSMVMRHPVDSGIQVCPSRNSKRFFPSRPADRSDSIGGSDSLTTARFDFIETLADIRTQEAGDLLRRIRLARSLRELWFLRAAVFSLVAHHRDQSEADHRLSILDVHFSRRPTPRPSDRRLHSARP